VIELVDIREGIADEAVHLVQVIIEMRRGDAADRVVGIDTVGIRGAVEMIESTSTAIDIAIAGTDTAIAGIEVERAIITRVPEEIMMSGLGLAFPVVVPATGAGIGEAEAEVEALIGMNADGTAVTAPPIVTGGRIVTRIVGPTGHHAYITALSLALPLLLLHTRRTQA